MFAHGSPEELGFSPDRLKLVRTRCEEWVENGTHPAIVALVARRGVVALHEAFGDASVDTIFPVASLTKPITATLVMSLVDEGRIGLTRPVQEYLPEFAGDGKEAVCVHHLLTHTTGLHDEEEVWPHVSANWRRDDLPATKDLWHYNNKVVALACEVPISEAPGECMRYSAISYVLLGEIVRRVAGKPLDLVARERIFQPLTMNDTGFPPADGSIPRLVRRPEDWAPGVLGSSLSTRAPSGSSGLLSTASDMAGFGQMFLNKGTYGDARVLSSTAVAEMTRDQIPGVPAVFFEAEIREASWSYGWGIPGTEKWPLFPTLPAGSFQHGGAGGTFVWGDPTNDLVAAFFSVARLFEGPPWTITNIDLFANTVYAALVD